MFSYIKKHKIALIMIVLLSTVGFFGYHSDFGNGKKTKVESARVIRDTLQEKLTISGTIDAQEKVSLRFQTSGQIAWVGVKEGDFVKKYQGIAALDQRILQKQIEKYLNDYLTSRWDFESAQKDTYKDLVISDIIKRAKEKSQFTLNKTVLDVEIQDMTKKYANLWSPIEGIVTNVTYAHAGVHALSTVDAYTIVNPKTVYFSVNAEQTEVTKLKEGLVGELTLDAYPDKKIPGTISQISFTPKANETGTVYQVKFIFSEPNELYTYRIGMTGDVTFITKELDEVLQIPVKFVQDENGKKYVFVSNRKELKDKRIVETGSESDNMIEIISGLKEGDTVYD